MYPECKPMKKQAIIISSLAVFLSVMVNIGELRCQENSDRMKEQYQSQYMERTIKGDTEEYVKDDNHVKVKILEWIIMNNLYNAYQGIDSQELEDRVEKSR
jgi:hypothetical protein